MTITEFVWFSDLMLKLRDKNSAKCKVTLMGIQNKEAVGVKMSTKFLKISMERDIQLKKQNWLISSAIDHKILFKEKLQTRESKLPVP